MKTLKTLALAIVVLMVTAAVAYGAGQVRDRGTQPRNDRDPDKVQLQKRLRDGSCQDAATGAALKAGDSADDAAKPARDCDRLRDGSCGAARDCDRDRDRLRDGSCGDGDDTCTRNPDRTRQQAQSRTQTQTHDRNAKDDGGAGHHGNGGQGGGHGDGGHGGGDCGHGGH